LGAALTGYASRHGHSAITTIADRRQGPKGALEHATKRDTRYCAEVQAAVCEEVRAAVSEETQAYRSEESQADRSDEGHARFSQEGRAGFFE